MCDRSRHWICFLRLQKLKWSRSCVVGTESSTFVVTLPKVLVADAISQRGIEELSRDGALEVSVQLKLSPNQLIELVPEFAGLIVRSETKVTGDVIKAAKKLRVIGRAG